MHAPHEHRIAEHGFYPPAKERAARGLRWPGGQPVAFAILLCAEHYELRPRPDAYAPVNVPGMFGRGPYPDIGSFSRREYGNRVGFFRVARLLADHGLAATAAIDAGVAARCPAVVDEVLSRGWPVAGHGRAVNDVLSSRLQPAQERDHIAQCLQALRAAGVTRVQGWHGAEYAESAATPSLLAQAGIRYLMDWPHDEQPVPMRTDAGPILSLPVCADFDDVNALWHRRIAPERWAAAILDAVDTMAADGKDDGRLYILNLHAWLIGQPFRAHALDWLLARLRRRDDVWFATTDDIADWVSRPEAGAGAGSPA